MGLIWVKIPELSGNFSLISYPVSIFIRPLHTNGNIRITKTLKRTGLAKFKISLFTLINKWLQSGELVDIMQTVEVSIKNLLINQVFVLYSNRKYLPAKDRGFWIFSRFN